MQNPQLKSEQAPFDKLVSTTTLHFVGTNAVAFKTVLPDGKRVANVVRMGEDGSAVATGAKLQY